MDNKKRKLETGQQEVQKQLQKFQLNGDHIIYWNINQEKMYERSSLFQGLFENREFEFENERPINLKLEKPENFCKFLKYIETGKIFKELNCHTTIIEYINDIIYLGIDELELHVQSFFETAVAEKKCGEFDFSEGQLSFDFMERVMRENQGGNSFELCQLLMGWMENNNNYIDSRKQMKSLTKFIQFENLEYEQIKKLAKKFPDLFDDIMKPSVLMTIKRVWRCRRCNKTVAEEFKDCIYCGKKYIEN